MAKSGNPFKLFGVQVGTTVAGAAVVAALRAWRKRRAARNTPQPAAGHTPAPMELSEAQALASAGDGDISLARPVVRRADTTVASAAPGLPPSTDTTESEAPVHTPDQDAPDADTEQPDAEVSDV
ncbi:MAG: hypothetical protein OSB03_12085, partial [Vicinamibacterales bacterium]|nr:hypothetical protein [Vicinamibacterales bacterium]